MRVAIEKNKYKHMQHSHKDWMAQIWEEGSYFLRSVGKQGEQSAGS